MATEPPGHTELAWLSVLKAPIVAVIITAGAGLIGVALTHRIDRSQLELERLKHDSAAILKTIELGDGNTEVIRTNLLFLINNKIIRDPGDTMRKHLAGQPNENSSCTGGVGVC
jgi:hypothetical protein